MPATSGQIVDWVVQKRSNSRTKSRFSRFPKKGSNSRNDLSRLKRQWQGRTRFFFRDQAGLKRYSRLKNQSASIDASWSRIRCFFPVSEHVKKIRGVGGKQAEPGVSSGSWIHRTPPNSVKWFVLTSTLTSTDDETTIYSVFWVKTFILMI